VENQVPAIRGQVEVTPDLFASCRDERDPVLQLDRIIRIGNVIDVEAGVLQGSDVERFAIRGELHIPIVSGFPAGGEFDFLDALFGGDHDFRRELGMLGHASTDTRRGTWACFITESTPWRDWWQSDATDPAQSWSTGDSRRSTKIRPATSKASSLGRQSRCYSPNPSAGRSEAGARSAGLSAAGSRWP